MRTCVCIHVHTFGGTPALLGTLAPFISGLLFLATYTYYCETILDTLELVAHN